MISVGQCRRTATLWLAAVVVLWAQAGAAMVCSLNQHGPECSLHAHMKAMPAPVEAVAAGCCPAHSVATSQCPSHPLRSVAAQDQDCCVLSKQPSRPFALLLSDGPFHSFEAAVTTAALETPVSSIRLLNPAKNPSFIKPVFDLKTDLRI